MTPQFYIAALGFLSYVASFAVYIWLHITPSGYSPVSNAVSDYGVGKTSKLFVIYLWLNNIGSIAIAFALIGLSYIPHIIPILLLVLTLSRIGLSLFPTDLEGEKHTKRGYLHYFFAIILFGLSYYVIHHVTVVVAGREGRHHVVRFLEILSWLTTASLIGTVITMWKPFRNIFGAIERVFILSTTFWFLALNAFVLYILR
jgi:hypothetical protein